MSINEYVKNRRLSEANYDLLHGKKVTDIAFKYGYQSMDGFTRAFKNWCGFLPSEISKRGEHKVFPKFNFIVKVSGGNSMECRIIEKSAFNFVMFLLSLAKFLSLHRFLFLLSKHQSNVSDNLLLS